MSSRKLDWRTINSKLDLIRRRLATLRSLGEVDIGWWDGDEGAALIVERVLIHIVDLAVDINNHVAAVELGQVADDYKATFPLAARAGVITDELARLLSPSAGTRNILVHEYLDVDHERVVLAARLAIEQYGEYVRQVAQWAQKRSGGR